MRLTFYLFKKNYRWKYVCQQLRKIENNEKYINNSFLVIFSKVVICRYPIKLKRIHINSVDIFHIQNKIKNIEF